MWIKMDILISLRFTQLSIFFFGFIFLSDFFFSLKKVIYFYTFLSSLQYR